ncbi:lipid A deacylase LpxR family protein [Teredinibacter haidensis]|uniref:lipid A deacylase LpxR family protein n=1 Tax=Teredinibacter haidensis TaxID=2731755 RepID=UPI0009F95736|nr:lipid A deacylase LpxR family protein [Teredinibacter haidensis]
MIPLIRALCFYSAFFVFLLSPKTFSADDNIRFVSFLVENDVFFQEDGGYTNGFAFSFGKGINGPFSESNIPGLLYSLIGDSYLNRSSVKSRGISYQFAQVMSTPEDIKTEALLKDQQPYAGLILGRINVYALDKRLSDRLGIIVGMVGPATGTEQTQKIVHRLIGNDEPMGWRHQLKDEPVLRVEASRSKRFWEDSFGDGLGMDVSGIAHGGIGNLHSDLGYTISWRFGRELNGSFPPAMNLPGREVNPTAGMAGKHWHLFVNMDVRYEFNNLLIEGNTYQQSHGVALRHEQAQISFGASTNLGRWAVSYTGAFSSRAYRAQPGIGKFGAISITYRID